MLLSILLFLFLDLMVTFDFSLASLRISLRVLGFNDFSNSFSILDIISLEVLIIVFKDDLSSLLNSLIV